MAAGLGQNKAGRQTWQLGQDETKQAGCYGSRAKTKQSRQADKLGWDKTKQSGWHGSWARTEQSRQADMAVGPGIVVPTLAANILAVATISTTKRGAQKLMGENLKVVLAEFST